MNIVLQHLQRGTANGVLPQISPKVLSPRRGSSDLRIDPTAYAVGDSPSVLRTCIARQKRRLDSGLGATQKKTAAHGASRGISDRQVVRPQRDDTSSSRHRPALS